MILPHTSKGRALGGAVAIAGFAAAAFLAFQAPAISAEAVFDIPAPAVDEASTNKSETAVFAGGCFWGVQGVFQHVKGVKNAVSGYAGGKSASADYGTVSTGRTGHAESVKVIYDPSKVTYGKLLQIYFSVAHNPTELNYQGPDHGTQYRSTVFTENAEQTKIAKRYIAQLAQSKAYPGPIVTTIETKQPFFAAEDHHQNFMVRNPNYPYIVFNDLPKVEALQKMYPDLYIATPVLVDVPNS